MLFNGVSGIIRRPTHPVTSCYLGSVNSVYFLTQDVLVQYFRECIINGSGFLEQSDTILLHCSMCRHCKCPVTIF